MANPSNSKFIFNLSLGAAIGRAGDRVYAGRCRIPTGAVANVQRNSQFHQTPGRRNPYAGVTLDRGGNLYGTAYGGGMGYGTVYKLTHKGSGWTVNPLYSFAGGSDGLTQKPE